MASLKQIEDFIASQPIAMAGVSRNPKKFGYMAFKELREKGLIVIPVNPSAAEILGDHRAYKKGTDCFGGKGSKGKGH
jgi:predicted CoA-binding protein